MEANSTEREQLDELADAPMPMCEAIPVAARKPWSPQRTCASRSSKLIFDAYGVGHYVCGMHIAQWERGSDDDRATLAAKWGWA